MVGRAGRRQEVARLNCIAHLLDQMPYTAIEHPPITLPERVRSDDYMRQAGPDHQIVVPERY